MQGRRQLLMWVSVIVGLSLILVDRLRNIPPIPQQPVNEVQSSLSRVDVASLVSESDLSAWDGEFSQGALAENQLTGTTTEAFEDNVGFPSFTPNDVSVSMRVYYVKKNDTLWGISRRHNLDVSTLSSVNKLKNPHLIHSGQAIKIPSQRGILHTVQRDETLEDIALRYNVTLQSIVSANVMADSDGMRAGVNLFVPGAKISEKYPTE